MRRRLAEVLLLVALIAGVGWWSGQRPGEGWWSGPWPAPPQVIPEYEQRRRPSPTGKLCARMHRTGEQSGLLRVVDEGDRDRELWSQACCDPSNVQVFWAQDGAALASLEILPDSYRLTVWKVASNRSRHYTGKYLEGEGALDLTFSPGHDHLLLRIAPVFGNYDVDLGRLWWLDLKTAQATAICETVRKVEWLDETTFRYWECLPDRDSDTTRWPLKVRDYRLPVKCQRLGPAAP